MPEKFKIGKILFPILVVATIVIFAFWLGRTPSGIFGWLHAIGYSVCHQIPSHSFNIGLLEFPLCSRCMGMYLGNLIGFTFLLTQGKKGGFPSVGYFIFFGLLILAWIVDGGNSFISGFLGSTFLYTTNNLMRLVTGFGMGLTMAVAVFFLFNQTVWKEIDKRSPFGNHLLLPAMILSSGILITFILNQNEILMTILAYLSVAMVVLLLTLLYAIVWMIILHKENQFSKMREMQLVLIIGLLCAILQIILLDAARFYLTGTWASLGI